MQEKINKNLKNWWLCENEYCNHPLGKIIKGDFMNVELVEIEGKNGEKFEVKPKFIDVFCKKCGEKNNIFGGKISSENWDNNIKQYIEWEEELNYGSPIKEFFINQYKRNLLLAKLTEKQRKIFNFLMQKKDEWEWKEAIKELNISKDIFLQDMDKIYLRAIKIDHAIRMKNLKLLNEELRKNMWKK